MDLLTSFPAQMKQGGSYPTVGQVHASPLGSFEAIYQHRFRDVCRWARSLGGPDADRDDIVQEVFLVVRRRLPYFQGDNEALPHWLYRITERMVRHFLRRGWFRRSLTHDRLDETNNLRENRPDPEAQLEEKEDLRVLDTILQKIPRERRVTFLLYEIEELSGEEIAQIQGISVGTVWSRLHKARRDFRALADKKYRALIRAKQKEAPIITNQGRAAS